MQVLVVDIQGCVDAEVNADSATHDVLTVERLADGNGRFDIEKGHDDAAEGFQWRPRVDWSVLVDELAHLDEVGGVEDFGFIEVGYYEGVGWRRGLDEAW